MKMQFSFLFFFVLELQCFIEADALQQLKYIYQVLLGPLHEIILSISSLKAVT